MEYIHLRPNCVIKYRFSRKHRIFDNLSLHPCAQVCARSFQLDFHHVLSRNTIIRCSRISDIARNTITDTVTWSPYTRSAKFHEFHKIHVKSIFEYIIGPRNIYVPLDILNMCIFYFGLPGNDCTKDEKTAEEVGRLRRPTSCAVLGS